MGTWETRGGFVAKIVQIKSLNRNHWVMSGFIQLGNVCFMSHWNYDGTCLGDDNLKFDLMRKVETL